MPSPDGHQIGVIVNRKEEAMRIGIDCRLAGKKHGGIGRYIEQLVTQLVQKTEYSWVLFFHDKEQMEDCFPKGLPSVVEIIFLPVKHYTIREQLLLPFAFQKAGLNLLHIPHFNVPLFYFGKKVVTIHDLLWHEYRGSRVTTLKPTVYWLKYLFYRLITSWSIITAEKIFVPSETIKKTLQKNYVSAKNKIVVTKEGYDLPDTSTQPISNKVKTFTKRVSTYILYVGSLYPHKNVSLVVESLKNLPTLTLCIVGSRSVFQNELIEKAQKENVIDRVHFMGYVSDHELSYLYAHATVLVQPSLSEGFGLTGIEAMALTTPILVSDIEIFKEIYQDYAVYFNPSSVDSFVAAYHVAAKQDHKTLAQKAKKILATYSWEKMAQQTVEIYQKICQTSQ